MYSACIGLLWFGIPKGRKRSSLTYASHWRRWTGAALLDHLHESAPSLYAGIFGALRRDLFQAMLAIAVNGVTAFGAAIAVRHLLARLLNADSTLPQIVLPGILCLALTYIAWLALNHTFFRSELIGIAARGYVEHRLLVARGPQGGHNLETLFEREASRIESAWSGLVVAVLALITVVYTAVFFLITLGVSAVAALVVILLSSIVVSRLAKRLDGTYGRLSVASAQRTTAATFALGNRVPMWLRNWDRDLLQRYRGSRRSEESALERAAWLMAAVTLISAVTPLAALLGAALLQLALLGRVDIPSILAAVAVVGTLRSVANGTPGIIGDIARGRAGHRAVSRYLVIVETSVPPSEPPPLTGRHIAIVGGAGSGKTTVLYSVARARANREVRVLVIPDEPWIVPGDLRENLLLFRRDPGDDEVADALRAARLPARFHDEYRAAADGAAAASWNVSRGQGKRFELARALLARPELVLIDQPTAGLDSALAQGLLADLLAGPWRDTSVVYVTGRPDEQAAADEVWHVADGEVREVRRNTRSAEDAHHAAPPIDVDDEALLSPEPAEMPVVPGRGARGSIRKSLSRFGILSVVSMVLALFAGREVLNIAGDYLLTSGTLVMNPSAPLWLAAVVFGSAVLSITGTVFVVGRTIGEASRRCVGYFADVIRPRRGTEYADVQDVYSRLTWDQRRVDEVLPALLVETLGAATLLAVTTGYVLANNVLAVLPVAAVGVACWVGLRRSDEVLRRFNSVEIEATARVLARVAALGQDGGRFAAHPDRRATLEWLSAWTSARAFASLDNSAARRWHNYRLDLIGIVFVGAVIGSSIYQHTVGHIGAADVLALSLCYSLIAIFARLGRCLVELRQILDSADRLAPPERSGTASAPPRPTPSAEPLVAFDDVTFVHDRNGLVVLERFSASFDPGEVIVITGESGIGKSTLAQLLIGVHPPTRGTVRTLGVDTGYLTSSHGREVHMLTSTPVFKPGRLADHFSCGDPVELEVLAKQLRIEHILGALPCGFDTEVGADGALDLSKSQQQCLALLDIALDRPAVAVLDEATSELSAPDEVVLLRTLISAVPDTLFVIVTHNIRLGEMATRRIHFAGRRRVILTRPSTRRRAAEEGDSHRPEPR
ncbi:ATP-binding cassette domain-containing protein [Nocardia sp. NPDC051570]|uniref:ATP-binding cassette domain-containing protein n=1 Tax=Nocardia sp. NPDC051570 TaxID=3364324 RepID=UPI0037AE4660